MQPDDPKNTEEPQTRGVKETARESTPTQPSPGSKGGVRQIEMSKDVTIGTSELEAESVRSRTVDTEETGTMKTMTNLLVSLVVLAVVLVVGIGSAGAFELFSETFDNDPVGTILQDLGDPWTRYVYPWGANAHNAQVNGQLIDEGNSGRQNDQNGNAIYTKALSGTFDVSGFVGPEIVRLSSTHALMAQNSGWPGTGNTNVRTRDGSAEGVGQSVGFAGQYNPDVLLQGFNATGGSTETVEMTLVDPDKPLIVDMMSEFNSEYSRYWYRENGTEAWQYMGRLEKGINSLEDMRLQIYGIVGNPYIDSIRLETGFWLPEPGTLGLMLAGLTLGCLRRRGRK